MAKSPMGYTSGPLETTFAMPDSPLDQKPRIRLTTLSHGAG